MSPKSHVNRKKRGFTLAETVVALTLITIVFGMTITSILTISSTYKSAENMRFFINEINNYLECYKLGGADKFSDSVNDYLFEGLTLTPPEGADAYECMVCYNADFNKTAVYAVREGQSFGSEYRTKGVFFVHIIINKSFEAAAYDKDDAKVFSSPKKYYSRYDL